MTVSEETQRRLQATLAEGLRSHRDHEIYTLECLDTFSAQIVDLVVQTIECSKKVREELESKFHFATNLAAEDGYNQGYAQGRADALSLPISDLIDLKVAEGYDCKETVGDVSPVGDDSSSDIVKGIATSWADSAKCIDGGKHD